MRICRRTRGLFTHRVTVAALFALLASGTAGGLMSHAADWRHAPLFAALLVLAVASEAFTIHFRGVRLPGSFAALVLAMALLGPAPAAVIALAAVLADDVLHRRGARGALWNAATYPVVPLLGGALLAPFGAHDPIAFAAAVVLVFLFTNALSFAVIAAYLELTGVSASVTPSARSTGPCSPSSSRRRS